MSRDTPDPLAQMTFLIGFVATLASVVFLIGSIGLFLFGRVALALVWTWAGASIAALLFLVGVMAAMEKVYEL